MQDVVKIIIERAGRYLFIQRAENETKPGYWSLPSGGLEQGETQAQAVVREALEEVGLVVRPVAKVHETVNADATYRLHWWTVEVLGGVECIASPSEVAAIRWALPKEVASLKPCFEDVVEYFSKIR